MSQQLLTDLCRHWATASAGDRALVCAVHDALVEAGYPNVAATHFKVASGMYCLPGKRSGYCSAVAAVLAGDWGGLQIVERYIDEQAMVANAARQHYPHGPH